ncbi:hypothetical protein ACOME3_002334 [Neoechinorhynchus agilis]
MVHLEDIPLLASYQDDRDIDSLATGPTDLGTTFTAYIARGLASENTGRVSVTACRANRGSSRLAFTPTDRTGSFSRDLDAMIRNVAYPDGPVSDVLINDRAQNLEKKVRNGVRVRSYFLLNRIGNSKKRLLGLCFAHRHNPPMLRALARDLHSRKQGLCAAFCKELEALGESMELVEKAEWCISRRTALLSSVRNRHFRHFCSPRWLSVGAVRALAGDGVSVFFTSYISTLLAGPDGYSQRLSDEWNKLMDSINGNPIFVPYLPLGYQMSCQRIISTNVPFESTLTVLLTEMLLAAAREFISKKKIAQDYAFLEEAETRFYRGQSVRLAGTTLPIWFSFGFARIPPTAGCATINDTVEVETLGAMEDKALRTLATGPCWDRSFHWITSDDIGPLAKIDFSRVLNIVHHLSSMIHRRDGSPATFARLRTLLSKDTDPNVTCPPPNGITNLEGSMSRFWATQPFEVLWIRMPVIEFLRSIAANSIRCTEGADEYDVPFAGNVAAMMEQWFSDPVEQLFRMIRRNAETLEEFEEALASSPYTSVAEIRYAADCNTREAYEILGVSCRNLRVAYKLSLALTFIYSKMTKSLADFWLEESATMPAHLTNSIHPDVVTMLNAESAKQRWKRNSHEAACGTGLQECFTAMRNVREALQLLRRLFSAAKPCCQAQIRRWLTPDLFVFGDSREEGHPNWNLARAAAEPNALLSKRQLQSADWVRLLKEEELIAAIRSNFSDPPRYSALGHSQLRGPHPRQRR